MRRLLAGGGVAMSLAACSSTASATPTPPTGPVALAGVLAGSTATCPGATAPVTADTCVLTVTQPHAGSFRATVTWDTADDLGIGLRDAAGRDQAPQLTGQRGSSVFIVAALAAGTYQLRVVNVRDARGPIHFRVVVG